MSFRNLSPQTMFAKMALEHVPQFHRVDLPDLQGLLAPRPLLVDIGANDTCFRPDTSMACYAQLENIYRAAGAADKLWQDLHPSDHAWGGNKSDAFFGKYL